MLYKFCLSYLLQHDCTNTVFPSTFSHACIFCCLQDVCLTTCICDLPVILIPFPKAEISMDLDWHTERPPVFTETFLTIHFKITQNNNWTGSTLCFTSCVVTTANTNWTSQIWLTITEWKQYAETEDLARPWQTVTTAFILQHNQPTLIPIRSNVAAVRSVIAKHLLLQISWLGQFEFNNNKNSSRSKKNFYRILYTDTWTG